MEDLLAPKVLLSLREDMPPVHCFIWTGREQYEHVILEDMYPFDTLHDIKRHLCAIKKHDPMFAPRFQFIGVPTGESGYAISPPTLETTYTPLDYLWYPTGTNDAKNTYVLAHPRKTAAEPDMRFQASDGSYANPHYELRGRSTIEQVFLKSRQGRMPVLHVFPFSILRREFLERGSAIGESEWNTCFAPYFMEISIDTQNLTREDRDFGSLIHASVSERVHKIDHLQSILEEQADVPLLRLSGVQQLRLVWKRPVKGFEGSASFFYRCRATDLRPFLRLFPAEGSGVTKLHVKGVIPIPTLDDPSLLEGWGNETTRTPGIDFCSIKYVHRPMMGLSPSIYGTIQVYQDGTLSLLVQPPKGVRKLDPHADFRTPLMEEVWEDLPQPFEEARLKEMSVTFQMKTSVSSKRFTKARILQRLPFFSSVFKEIRPLPQEQPFLSLRYKAVSQYAVEDNIFTFITQLATKKSIEGEAPDASVLHAIQQEFSFTQQEALDAVADWFKKKGNFTVQVPEEGEFVESYHSGIDIHIHVQEPSYYFHIHRVDDEKTYERIFTLLSLLFMEDDSYFQENKGKGEALEKIDEIMDEEQLAQEERIESVQRSPMGLPSVRASAWRDPFANEDELDRGEVLVETAPSAVAAASMATASAAPRTMRPRVVDMAPSVATMRSRIVDPFANEEPDASDASDAPDAPVAAASSAAASSAPASAFGLTVHDQKQITPQTWFLRKLQEMDPFLFVFKTDSEENGYSRKCAGHEDRQPAVLTEDQYERMREIYIDDPIFWMVYPLEGKKDVVAPMEGDEIVTVMRYGSDVDHILYYFCPPYFCLSDEIMVRPVDFEKTKDRQGRPKPKDSCPFCHGKLITSEMKKKKVAPLGHTVMKRRTKTASENYHNAIRFLKDTTHPNRLALPCCFLTQSALRMSDPAFEHIRSYFQQENLEDHVDQEEIAKEEYQRLLITQHGSVAYPLLFETIHKQYIVESNKHPNAGVFAMVPPLFDQFFAQESTTQLVERRQVHLKLRSNAQGFLRIGTETPGAFPYESLLAILAPLLRVTSIDAVKERLRAAMIPRVFLNAHFGNLVLEFFRPEDGSAMPATRQELAYWANKELGIAVNSHTLYPLLRVYNAYQRFLRFLQDPKQRKDLRHLQPLLSEPGLLSPNGLQLIILEDNGAAPVTIRCPPFGVSLPRNEKNDVAFLSRMKRTHAPTGVVHAKYELYVHTSNKPAKGAEQDKHESIVLWTYATRSIWPPIVQQRVTEFMTQCQNRYHTLYTAQQSVNPRALIPLSSLIVPGPIRPEGVIKDSYNHIIGVTFPYQGTLIPVPVIDDGVVSISSAFSIKNIYLDGEDIKPPLDYVLTYYETILAPRLSLYPGYQIDRVIQKGSTVIAIQLKHGAYLPVSAPIDKDVLAKRPVPLPVSTLTQLESDINRQLMGQPPSLDTPSWDDLLDQTTTEKTCGTDPMWNRTSSSEQLEEWYQQFRLMVSRWIAGPEGGAGLRKGVEEIIFSRDLPEYERRKRLHLYIGSTIASWLYPDENKWDTTTSFLRKDCRVIDNAASCTGSCVWRADQEEDQDDRKEDPPGQCLLHVPARTPLDKDRMVSTSELFTKRIIDELVRFPNRRKQLLRPDGVSKVSTLLRPIHEGDQYLIPESSTTWTQLLQLDWNKSFPERPQYYEEMSREEQEREREEESSLAMPADLHFLGDRYTFRVADEMDANRPLLPFMGALGVTLEELGLEETATILRPSHLTAYVKLTQRPIGMIQQRDANEKEIQIVRPSRSSTDTIVILVFLADRIGLLEENGNPQLPIATLPPPLLEAWKAAPLVMIRPRLPPASLRPVEPVINPVVPAPSVPLIAPRRIRRPQRVSPVKDEK